MDAQQKMSNYGYRPRYEPNLKRSLKIRKYEKQSLQEALLDTPRIQTSIGSVYTKDYGIDDPEVTRSFFYNALDHARIPGTFDYTKPQTYHAVFPDVEQEAYVEVGGNNHKMLRISQYSS